VIADFNFNGEPTMKEKKNNDRSPAEMPGVWQSSSMVDEEASGAGDGQTELRGLIARRAYEIYEERGKCDGADVADWLQAEVEVKSLLIEARLRPRASGARA
jgi:DUF2934 family protein